MSQAITVDAMRDKLVPLDVAQAVLARTEPLQTHAFTVGDQVRFTVDPGWQAGNDARAGSEPVPAAIHLGVGSTARRLQLTKDAVLEATSIIGLGKDYAARCPAALLEPQLNYWFREGLAARRNTARDFQLLAAGGVGGAITRASIVPFSNLALLEHAADGIRRRYGTDTEILVDYKFTHSLRRTAVRLIVPQVRRTITGTDVAGDEWSVGLQVTNSLIGESRTAVDGYLFRWICTNGAIDTRASSGAWTRRSGGREDEVYAWARATVDEVLGGLEPALDAVQATVDITIDGHANEVLRDVFNFYHTPINQRAKIIERMVEAGTLTMYSVMAAITEVANTPGLDPAHVESLMRMGGDLPHAATSRCDACRRLLPH